MRIAMSTVAIMTLLGACTKAEPVDMAPVPTPAAVPAAEPTPPAAAPVPALAVRRFLHVEGDVTLDNAPAKDGLAIGDSSAITTGKDSFAVITLEPGSVIEIRAQSSLKLGANERAKLSLKLLTGAVWSFIPKGASYEVDAPNAVAGVRGTAFFVEVGKRKDTYICACSGDVAIQTADTKSFNKVVSSPKDDHKGFVFTAKGKKQAVKKAPRHNHTDAQKLTLMPYMEAVKPQP